VLWTRRPRPQRPPSTPTGAKDAPAREPRVQSVARAASFLFAVARTTSGLRALEIAETLGLPRQATYHLLHTLVTLGMPTKGADNRYLLGLRIGALVEAFSRQLAPPERLLPYVRQVANETGETAYAVGWWDGEITTLAVVRGRNAIQTAEVP
jgi:IclR family acetate operon transcriptional repressor